MIRLSWGIALAFIAGLVVAAPTGDSYWAEVPLKDKSDSEYSNAVRRALADVLIRVTGHPGIDATAGGKAILARADQLLQQYRVRSIDEPAAEQQPPLVLQARFNPQAVDQALRELGLTMRGMEPMPLLVWLAVEEQGKRYIVAADSRRPLATEFRRAAQRRGLPVLFPLLDLEDRSQVLFADVWQGNFDSIQRASRRYDVPAILIGRLTVTKSGAWSAQWTLSTQGLERRWETWQSGLQELVADGVDTVVARLASRTVIGPVPVGTDRLQLTVEGIASSADYARVTRHLESLAPVQTVQIIGTRDSELRLSLEFQGNPAGLDDAIASGRVLEPLPGAPDKRYRLRP